MIERIYVVRHGEREDFVDPNWSDTHERYFDPPLSAHGFDQAEEVSKFFADKKIDMIFSSPLARAIQTAIPTANALGMKIHIEYGLNEFYSPYYIPGEKPAFSIKELSEQFPGTIDTEYKSLWTPIEDHEEMDEFIQRLKHVMEKFLDAEKEGKVRGTIVLFTHAASVQAIAINLLNDPKYSLKCPVGGITVLKRDLETGAWSLELPPSAAHLSRGAEHSWSFDNMKKFPSKF